MLQSARQQVKRGGLPQGSRSILYTQTHTQDFSLDFPPRGPHVCEWHRCYIFRVLGPYQLKAVFD